MIKKCVFPVAGYGTRFLPATKSMPKEMLPIVNKPLVHYGVEEAIDAGLKECGFVTGRGKRAIADSYTIRRSALQHKVNYSTTLAHGKATCMALDSRDNVKVNRLQKLHEELPA